MPSPYEVLGVEPGADEEAVDRAYRKRVIETHPDQGGSVRAFQRVQAAYEELAARDDGEVSAPAVDGDRADDEAAVSEATPDAARVEYLDYEAVVDHGWDLRDEELFDRASAADLDHEDYGRFLNKPEETLLEASEERGFSWPYSCRGGACANCAVAVVSGDLSLPANHILPEEFVEEGIRLSCVGCPLTDEVQVVHNVKHLPALEELLLPPRSF